MGTLTNSQAIMMLDQVKVDIQEHYYDPTFHGFDLDGRFSHAKDKIQAAKSQDDSLLAIAAAVSAMKDSHTNFRPPVRPYHVDWGFSMMAVGDTDCYVDAVRPGSDAESKGLKPGDRILSLNGITMAREDIFTVRYGYLIFPQSGFHLDVQSPDGQKRSITVLTTVIPGQKEITGADVADFFLAHRTRAEKAAYFGESNQPRFFELSKSVLLWKLPDFAIDPADLEEQTAKARNYETIILDLRGNPGGRVDALSAFLGEFFERNVKIDDEQTRHGTREQIAQGKGKKAISAKLIVLIDSRSASAAEIFSRVIQLEKRGTVIGDLSSGRVMESQYLLHAIRMNPREVTQFSTSVTVANLIMTDGKSLENIGVTPDQRVIPTPADMLAGDDPALTRAASLAGVEITPSAAGKILPIKWPDKPRPIE